MGRAVKRVRDEKKAGAGALGDAPSALGLLVLVLVLGLGVRE